MSLPKWITPAGFLGTATERVNTSFLLETETTSTFSLISGSLPSGLKLSSGGLLAGTPFSVGETLTNQFVIRARNSEGITDRTFIVDTEGPTAPVWLTPTGYLRLGLGGQYYVINKTYVDYQLSAIYDVLPTGQKLRYYIGELEGTLPPGLTLSDDGRITGFITDNLSLDYLASITGGYDTENYDRYPFEHSIIYDDSSVGQRPKYLSKIYQFYVTVTDGVADAKRLFQIKVENPLSLRVDTTLVDVDTTFYTADASYLVTPQWLSPVDLGYVRTSNYQVIQLEIYDPEPNTGPTVYDWNTPIVNIDGSPSEHPPHFDLDPVTGVLYAKLPYQPAYSTPYKFTVRLIKTDAVTGETSYKDRTFTLTVKGNIESILEFVTEENLGSISPGYVSELAVVAQHTNSDSPVQYRLISGQLPSGLSLALDGTIVGRVNYNSQTYIDLANFGFGSFKLDGGTTTIDAEYKFTVQASDIYQQSLVDKQFSISVGESTISEFVRMHIRPFMNTEDRRSFSDFINSPEIFDRSLLYRPLDPEFGVQKEMKFTLEHGIKKYPLRAYASSLNDYFVEQRFTFNGVKTAVSKDNNGNVIYEVIYVELLDELGNTINNMKNYLDANFETDEFTMPNWMRTIQSSYGAPLGFVKAIPLCYALPGASSTILKRLELAKFDFKLLDFTADRLLISSTTDYLETKYLLFPRRYAGGTTLALDLILTVPEGGPLLTEDGSPLLDLE